MPEERIYAIYKDRHSDVWLTRRSAGSSGHNWGWTLRLENATVFEGSDQDLSHKARVLDPPCIVTEVFPLEPDRVFPTPPPDEAKFYFFHKEKGYQFLTKEPFKNS